MVIGILYIGIGKYISLWTDFYRSSEKYLFPDAVKRYFVFTDQGNLFPETVTFFHQEDLGTKNSLYRFKIFYEHRDDLSQCDYLFFFNGDALLKRTIFAEELLPGESDGYLSALSWHIYRIKPVEKLPYDRNPNSTAFIPYGKGQYYFQGGLNGGRTKEYLELIEFCMRAVDTDTLNGIVAAVLDESYLNKYLLDRKVKVLGTEYGKPEKFFFPLHVKMIFRDKNDFFKKRGMGYIRSLDKRPFVVRFLADLRKYVKAYFCAS